MEHNQNDFTPEASTDERASSLNFEPGPTDESGRPTFVSPEAEQLYWRAYMDGARALGREPGHPHMPADFSLDLTRDGTSPGLVSGKLIEAWPEAVPVPGGGSVETGYGGALPSETSGRKPRHDGWTGERQRLFLDVLAATGVVADACRAVSMGRDSAYALRKRAEGRAFALAWNAAILIGRRNVADDVMSRARHGVVDRVYRNGELVAERHRYDNRLTMAVLTRLDRLADGLGEGAATARTVAQEWDQFLDIVDAGGDGAEAFLRARADPPRNGEGSGRPASGMAAACRGQTAPAHDRPKAGGGAGTAFTDEIRAAAALLARLAAYERHAAGLPQEIRTDDLDPAEMERWTEEQWARAEFSGFLDTLPADAWPASAREEADADGMCRVRRLYVDRHPAPAETQAPADAEEEDEEDDFEGCSLWEDDAFGWLTDFPPPPGFDGYEENEPGDEDYRRELTAQELETLGEDPESLAAEQAERLAAQHQARNRFFGFTPGMEEEPDEGAGEEQAAAAAEAQTLLPCDETDGRPQSASPASPAIVHCSMNEQA